MKNDISDLIVNTDVMAQILGLTRQRVNQLALEGIIEKKAPGRYLLMENVQRYITFMRTGKISNDAKDSAGLYWSEKALHEKAKRENAELNLAQKRGELHLGTNVEMVMTHMLITFRNRMLIIPSKMSPLLVGRRDQGEIEDLLDNEIRAALTNLSEYDPAMFFEQN